MNTKDRFITDQPNPTYLHEVNVNGYTLKKGMHVTLAARTAHGNNRRYQFSYAEDYTGTLLLVFYGPLRSTNQRYRMARPDEIVIVHTKTKHIAEETA
jgi:hypothetical protein